MNLIEKLRTAAENATPGPWVKVSDLPDFGIATTNQPDFHPDPIVTRNRAYRAPNRKNLGCSESDADFIALANPQAVLALIQAYEKLREGLEDLAHPDCYLEPEPSDPITGYFEQRGKSPMEIAKDALQESQAILEAARGEK